MDDLLRKALLFGVGVTAITKEKAEKLVKELRKKEKLDPEEGKRMVRELMKVSEKKAREFAGTIETGVAEVLAEAAGKSDLGKLERKLKQKGKALARKAAKKGAAKLAKVVAVKAAKRVLKKARKKL